MVKHIIFWTLKNPERKAEAAALLTPKFKALLGVVDGLTEIEIGCPDGDQLVLYSVFTSWQALQGYQEHPAHLAIKDVVHPLGCARQCCDYEL